MLKKISGFLSLAFLIGGALVLGANAQAAADETLVSTIASTSDFFSENANVIVGYIVDIMLKLAGIALAIGAVYWVYRKIRSIFNK